MLDADRFKLLFRPYRMPRCRVGRFLRCAVRGEVRVVGTSEAPIPWPQCKAGKHLVPIVCGGLLRAIQRESVLAVAHHWRVNPHSVVNWRKAIGVAYQDTEGTRRLRLRWSPKVLTPEVREKARQGCKTPEYAAASRERTKGRKVSAETLERMRQARLGKRASKKTRAKMSAAHRQRYDELRAAGEGWQHAWDALLGTMPDKALARQLGLHKSTVFKRRTALGIPSHRPHRAMTPPRTWTAEEDKLLGTMSDAELAARLGCTSAMVFNQRAKLGVPPFVPNAVARDNIG